jgi:hypothetical protein
VLVLVLVLSGAVLGIGIELSKRGCSPSME